MAGRIVDYGTSVNTRGTESLEIVGQSFTLVKPENNVLMNNRRCITPVYGAAELLWYLSRSRSVDQIAHYAPQYSRFAEKSGTAWGAYGHRIYNDGADQLDHVIRVIKEDPHTRRCVLSLYRAEDLFCQSKKDVPCTLSLQFLVRDGALHLIVTMRSNDLWLGTPYDVFCFTCIQILVAGSLGLSLGHYTHQVGSLHIYKKDVPKCIEALEERITMLDPKTIRHNYNYISCTMEEIGDAIKIEALIRKDDDFDMHIACFESNPLLRDLLLLCATKVDKSFGDLLHSHAFKESLDAYYRRH